MAHRKIIKKPRKRHFCSVCGKAITGAHVYCWQFDVWGNRIGSRFCAECAVGERVSDEFRSYAKENLQGQLFSC